MKKLFIVSCSAAMAFVLVGCGGGKALPEGKEGAANALAMVSQAMAYLGNTQSELTSGATYDSSGTGNCPQGGTIGWTSHYQTEGTGAGTFQYALDYNACNVDGKTAMEGNITYDMSSQTGGGTSSFDYVMNGRVDFSGDIEDFLEVDIHYVGTVTTTGSNQYQYSVTLDGTITNSTGSYDFDNEAMNVSGQVDNS